jgi:predicted GIY-YIG superfamily endonuclease
MNYYVYIHANQDGKVFYVGKGSGRRVYSMNDRSYEWHEEQQKHDGLLMKIVRRFSTETEAYAYEKELVAQYRKDGAKLVNKSDGGLGPSGYVTSEARKRNLSEKITGYVHKKITCPHCGKTGGETSMKRWHFNNCKGIHPYKARATGVDGVRVYLGRYSTQEEADKVMVDFYRSVGKPIPKEFFKSNTGRTKEYVESI